MQKNIDVIRYTNFELPSRKFIPGKGIHPDKDPTGPHIPKIEMDQEKLNPSNWQRSENFLYAIDLFNNGYWWEAHEVLEKLWVQTGKTTPIAIFLQGLIQISAALLKDSQSLSRGSAKLLEKGLPKIQLQTGLFLGIDGSEFASEIEAYFAKGSSAPFPPRIQLIGL